MAYPGMMYPMNQHAPGAAGGAVHNGQQTIGYQGHQQQQQQQAYDGSELEYLSYNQAGPMWSYPQAPRLTAAAVRASSMAVGYPYQTGYSQYPHFYPPTSTPWGNGATADHYGRQQQDHQQLEHQLMLHHQLSKLQVPHQSERYSEHNGEAAYSQGGTHWDQSLDGAHRVQGRQDGYAQPPARYQPSHSNHHHQPSVGDSHNTAYHGLPNAYAPQDNHMRASYVSQPYADHHGQSNGIPSHAAQQRAQQYAVPSDPRLAKHRGSDPAWDAYNSGRRAQEEANMHAHSQAQAQAQAHAQAHMHAQAQAEAHARAQAQAQAQAQAHAQVQAQAAQTQFWEAQRRASQQWLADGARGGLQHQSVQHDEVVAPEKEAQPAASNDGPAPPSPDTLDRSAVPISSFGAEVVWAVAAAMLEPALLPRSSSRGRFSSSGSALSTSSSPLLSTPATSPWASATLPKGDWSVPSISPAMSLTSPQARVNSFDVSNGANALRRFALQAQQQQQGTKGHKRLSTTLDSVGGSPTSSVSSSEPGTPPSMRSSEMIDDSERSSTQLAVATRGLGLANVSTENDSPTSDGNVSPLSKGSQPRLRSDSRPRTNSSMQKLQSAVTSVMGLVSPDWEWSLNDDKLPSLRCEDLLNSSPQSARSGRSGSVAGSKSVSRRPSGTGLGMLDGDAPVYSYGSGEASPAFRRFVHQVLAQTLLSPTAFLLALMFTIRIPYLFTNEDGLTDQEALQIFAQPPSAAPFKLLTLGLMMSNKHLDDNTFLNKTWNEVTGIALPELNLMERYFLKRSGFEISPPDELWTNFVLRVRQREESKLAAHQQARMAASTAQMRISPRPSHVVRRSSDGRDNSQASSEDCSRRVIGSTDEVLAQLGQIPPLSLSEPSIIVASPPCLADQLPPIVTSEPLPHRPVVQPPQSASVSVANLSYDEERSSLDGSLARSHSDYVDQHLGKARARHSIVLPRMQSSPAARAARRASEYGLPRMGALSRQTPDLRDHY